MAANRFQVWWNDETDLAAPATARLAVLRLLAQSASISAIANQLHISRTTVNNHIQRLLHKLNAHSRPEAIRRAEYAGLI